MDGDSVLESIVLKRGTHASREEGMCAMEAVAFLADEPHGDHPRSACPVLSTYLRVWNDAVEDDEERTRLFKPWIARVARSRSTSAVEAARAHQALDWIVREHLAEWLSVRADLRAHAERLRMMPAILDLESAKRASEMVRAAARAAAVAWDPERNAAIGSARVSARQAAAKACRTPGWDGAWAVAFEFARASTAVATGIDGSSSDPAIAATTALAAQAARDAAWVVAWLPAIRGGEVGARSSLAPIEDKLAASMVDLFERMLVAGS